MTTTSPKAKTRRFTSTRRTRNCVIGICGRSGQQNVKLEPNDVSVGFRIKNSGNTLISAATEGELGLYHVKDPSDGNESWAANKGYVDDNFINIAGQTDLDSQVFKIRQPNSEEPLEVSSTSTTEI